MAVFPGNNHLNEYVYNIVKFDFINQQFNQFNQQFDFINQQFNQFNVNINNTLMRPIKYIDINETYEYPFEGVTYVMPKDKVVLIPDALARHLEDNMPLTFSFGGQLNKDKKAPEAATFKTKSYIQPDRAQDTFQSQSSMHIVGTRAEPTFASPDSTPASGVTDRDGVEWYGEGMQIEGGKASE